MKLNLDSYTIREAKLKEFGFVKRGRSWWFARSIGLGDMMFRVEVKRSAADIRIYDGEDGDEYVLYQVVGAQGSFVGAVQAAIEDFRAEFIARCCEREEFHSKAGKRLLAEAARRFGETPEFLWKQFPRYAVLRRKDNEKWYAVFMVVPPSKLGLEGEGEIEIVDLRVPETGLVLDNVRYFPGWHMNKKTWFTALLDGAVNADELTDRLFASRERAADKSKFNLRKGVS